MPAVPGVTICDICNNALVLHQPQERVHCRAERIRRGGPAVQPVQPELDEGSDHVHP